MKKDTDELANDLAIRFLTNAEFLAQMGFINQDIPGMKNGLAVLKMLMRRRRKEPAVVRYPNGVSAAVAVSQSLGQPLAVPNRSCWPAAMKPTAAGSAEQPAKTPKAQGKPILNSQETGSDKTVTLFSREPKANVAA